MRDYNSKKKTKIIKMKYFTPLILLFFISCATIVRQVLPLENLPLPTGQYNVGTKIYTWEDSSRKEWFGEESNKFRRIPVQVWFPMEGGTKQLNSPYLQYPQDYIRVISADFDIPGSFLLNVKNIRTSATIDGNPKSGLGKRPIIIFSHGLGGFKNQNTIQMEELASHGYIIFACDHVYDAGFVRFSEDEIIYSKSFVRHFPKGTTDEEYWDTREKHLLTRSQDISFIIDQIKKLDTIDPALSPLCDSQNISLMGHSFGGSTVLSTLLREKSINSCIALDAWTLPMPSHEINQDINTSLLHLGQLSDKFWGNKNNRLKLDTLVQNNKKQSIRIRVPQTKHFDYSDFSYFTWATKLFGITGKINREKFRLSLNKILVDYLNYITLNKGEFTVERVKQLYGGIEVITN